MTVFSLNVTLVDKRNLTNTADMESLVEVRGQCHDTIDSSTFVGVLRNGVADFVTRLRYRVRNGAVTLTNLVFSDYCLDMKLSFRCYSPGNVNHMCTTAFTSELAFSNEIATNTTTPSPSPLSYVAFDLSMGM